MPAVLKLVFFGTFWHHVTSSSWSVCSLTCQWIQENIRIFCQGTSFQVTQEIFHLHHIWSARRSRWWLVLAHPIIGKVLLQPFPVVNPTPMLSNLLNHVEPITMFQENVKYSWSESGHGKKITTVTPSYPSISPHSWWICWWTWPFNTRKKHSSSSVCPRSFS